MRVASWTTGFAEISVPLAMELLILTSSYSTLSSATLSVEIKLENGVKSAKVVTNVQTFRDCALHQWNVS